MCTEVFVVIHSDAITTVERKLIEWQLGSGLEPRGRRVVAPDEELLYVIPWGQCHCGTALGAIGLLVYETQIESRHGEPRQPRGEDSALRRKKRRGWSEARIARSLEEERRRVARKEDDLEQRARLVHDDDPAQGWVPLIREVLAERTTARVGLVVSTGGPGPLERGSSLAASELNGRWLAEMRNDSLYTVTA